MAQLAVSESPSLSAQSETTPCPLCGADAPQPAYRFDPFAIVYCTRCGVHYLSPRLTEQAIQQHYAQDSYFEQGSMGYASYSQQEKALRLTFRRFLQNLQRASLTGGALLEIGCGYGYLLDEAKPYFATRVGTDFSSGAVAKSRQVADQVYHGGVEAVPHGRQFDCIIAANVLEHTYQPIAFLQTLASRLRSGGTLVMACPNMDSILRPLMGKRWPSFKLPEHILYFNQHTLTYALREAGLKAITPLPYPHAFPVSLIAGKFSIRLPSFVSNVAIWVPTTMAAVYGQVDG